MSSASSSDRKPVNARVVDIAQRKGGLLKPTQYAYVLDVSWSDGSHTQIWRSYPEFFHFQCDLLSAFPEEASDGDSKSREIPFLPGKKLLARSTKKLAESRREGINSYIQALMQLKSTIVESDQVRRFLEQKSTDPVALDQKRSAGTLHSASAAVSEDDDEENVDAKGKDGSKLDSAVPVSDETSARNGQQEKSSNKSHEMQQEDLASVPEKTIMNDEQQINEQEEIGNKEANEETEHADLNDAKTDNKEDSD